ASQVASTLSEPEASTQHRTKRRKLRATSTWDHFREAQGDEPRTVSGRLLHYCTRCRNPSWSTHISGNARYHLEKAHHILVQESLTDSGSTGAGDLTRAYDAHRESVKRWLERARSLVHISMDVWSSPQRKAYIAIHA
ncbi:hypothetical protein EDB80DRAFT_536657, partial [Ilyonectria destructans]